MNNLIILCDLESRVKSIVLLLLAGCLVGLIIIRVYNFKKKKQRSYKKHKLLEILFEKNRAMSSKELQAESGIDEETIKLIFISFSDNTLITSCIEGKDSNQPKYTIANKGKTAYFDRHYEARTRDTFIKYSFQLGSPAFAFVAVLISMVAYCEDDSNSKNYNDIEKRIDSLENEVERFKRIKPCD